MDASIRSESSTTVTEPRSAVARYLPVVARVVMGLIFFGAGSFGMLMALGVIAMPPQNPPPSEAAAAFMGGIMKSGYFFPLLKATEIVTALLLLANRMVPLALVVLAPIVVNIFAVHAFLMPSGLPMAILLVVLESYLGFCYRDSFRPLFARAQPR